MERSALDSATWEILVPSRIGGCVYLLYLRDKLVYVGQTESLLVRLGKHQEGGKVFDRVRYGRIPDLAHRLSVETRLIQRYNPPLNKKQVLFTKRRPSQVYGVGTIPHPDSPAALNALASSDPGGRRQT